MEVNKGIIEGIDKIIVGLDHKRLSGAEAFMGFDACIDTLVRVVKDKKENRYAEFFDSSSQLGEFLINLENKSCGVELQTKLSKPGGNMVITGNALGNLGIRVECIGTFGLPDILPIFRTMSSNCSLHTVGDTITATALEFNESKVITFDPGPYRELDWDSIKNLLGVEKIKKLISGKRLIAFVNWSEIENSSAIWKSILEEILPSAVQKNQHPLFFTDFSDCSRRSKGEIRSAIGLLAKFRDYFKVMISLNQNEADLIAGALDLPGNNSDEDFIKRLFRIINADILVLHRVKDALAFDGLSFEKCETFFCREPKILTGGGDNFNAGFCFARLYGFDLVLSLIFANAVSGYYVKTGISPGIDNLTEFLKQERSFY